MSHRFRPATLAGHTVQQVHCVGVGGMGLGPLAIYLAGLGFTVSGEDDGMTEAMLPHLLRAGVNVTGAGQVPEGAQLLVVSSAIPPDHPAAKVAAYRGLPTVRRGELLADVTAGRKLIAICGSHGKTTTTAMTVTALRALSWPVGYILGGLFADPAVAPAAVGETEWVVAEVDESDGTIERYHPEITLAVNLDWDHPDHYRDHDALLDTFGRLFERTRANVLVASDCRWSTQVVARAQGVAGRAVTFGPKGQYNLMHDEEGPEGLRLTLAGRFEPGAYAVQARGDFNARNATAALAIADVVGAKPDGNALAVYPGVLRRQSELKAPPGFRVVEDYAHHPEEIRSLLNSLRRRVGPAERLVVVFQPHRYSRTRQFLTAFAQALAAADWVALLDVYGAGEAPLEGGTTSDLYAELRRAFPQLDVEYCGGHRGRLLAILAREVRPGDTVAWVGAGDLDQSLRQWLPLLQSREAEASRWDGHANALRGILSVDTKIRREESLAERTTLRVGGAARLLLEPATEDDVRLALGYLRKQEIPTLWLGRGSNLVVPDEGVDGAVLTLAHPNWQAFEVQKDGRIWVGAGLRLKNLCGLAAKHGYTGFEFLEGIPGNVGGALRMNAGAMGGWMFDVVDAVRLLTPEGRVEVRPKQAMEVDYRHCADLHSAVALGAWLRPAAAGAPTTAVAAQIEAYREKRQKSQPREPSAGCIFKNPPGDHAGRLIDVTGLKGERVGGALVSPVHANFIVNTGGATSADVITLVRRVRARVQAAHGVTLEPEVILFGRTWQDVL